MYQKNYIYITPAEQQHISNIKIVFAGLGLGSVIAECALRFGFENLHLIDGDTVEKSNLNRQNYTLNDIGKPKAVALYERLKQINSNANITYASLFLTEENMSEHLAEANIAVNAIDFASNAPLIFDKICFDKNIPVVHPYNLGFGGLACVLTKESLHLTDLSETHQDMEIKVVKHVIRVLNDGGFPMNNLKKALDEYISLTNKGNLSPPQLSIASWMVGGMCTDIFFKIAKNEAPAIFPEFYYMDNNIETMSVWKN